MADASAYSAIEGLRDGRRVVVRAVKPSDRDALVEAFERASAASLYRRFFAVKRHLSEQEIAFFSNVDFVNHVALVVVAEEDNRPFIVGGGRYIVVQPGRAEVAFAILDLYQGQGLGTALMRHLIGIARKSGLKELFAEVLPENSPMPKVFEKSTLRMTTKREAGIVHVSLELPTSLQL